MNNIQYSGTDPSKIYPLACQSHIPALGPQM
jgi:hypothetical protein